MSKFDWGDIPGTSTAMGLADEQDSSEQQIVCGSTFTSALCEHFGLLTAKVDSEVTLHTGADEILGVTLRIALTPADLARIAERMAAAG